jgi:transaldolase
MTNDVPAPGGLKLLVDTAEVSTWERLLPSGVFYGVTTNPKLINQARLPCSVESLRRLAQAAFDLGANEIHLQVWGSSTAEMLAIGRELAEIDPRVRVKVPGIRAGFPCARTLAGEGARVTLTALYAAQQTLAAISLGAAYAVPYLGRMNDAKMNGLAEVIAMQEIINQFPGSTRVLVASIRQLSDVVTLARHGVGVYALQPSLAEELLDHPLSIQAAADFEANAQEAKQRY